ncbi:hypothetical protein GCM10025880_11530 [Methylorubrum aminovorans]|nr:hypothetical protein GCM10025880_11530 [Methylorubrum aminovorans]
MQRAATDDATRLRAARAHEEAIVYEAYERLLSEADALDFGDLVMRPVRLAAEHPDVAKALSLRHRHLLVDEYQDVNLATVRLIRALAADEGERLWVVGDARQSIYRFRGATSASMAAFRAHYPGATLGALDVNYRSRKEIIDTFTSFAASVDAFRPLGALGLAPDRGRPASNRCCTTPAPPTTRSRWWPPPRRRRRLRGWTTANRRSCARPTTASRSSPQA